jgi:SAM-dependent methyltransferase
VSVCQHPAMGDLGTPSAPAAGRAASVRGLSRQFVKLCDRRDFDDPRLRAAIRDIVPGRPPDEEIERKLWEYGMLALFLDDVGDLREDAEVLAVGAGHEHVLYWLANRVRRVVATDIYGEGDFAGREAKGTMVDDPARFAPYAYREDRLEARWMDGRTLDFPDASFDVVFTLSSIEHFGAPADVAAASREIARVLRPGGHAAVVTECFTHYHPLDSKLVQTGIRLATLGRRCSVATPRRRMVEVFTPRELRHQIVEPSGLQLMQPLRRELSPETAYNITRFRGAGTLEAATGRYYPHLLLRADGAPWTSAFLAFAKPPS